MEISYALHAAGIASIVIGMTLLGFICGLAANIERIGRIARWKARLESGDPQDRQARKTQAQLE